MQWDEWQWNETGPISCYQVNPGGVDDGLGWVISEDMGPGC